MLTPTIAGVLARDLRTLAREIEAFSDDASVWKLPPGAPNSAGTLALHLTGNLRHFVGATLGGTGYRRDRDAEFARRDVPRGELARGLRETADEVERVLRAVPDSRLAEDYPEPFGKHRVRTDDALMHLVAHLGYHLGQADYHRRLVTGDRAGVGAMAVGELGTARRGEGASP